MTDIVEFLIFGMMTGLSSAIGASLAKIWIEPKLLQHKNNIDKRIADIAKQLEEVKRDAAP